MKLLKGAEDAPQDRRFKKSQVEKRRRERINRSLERLRTMLLQEPQQSGIQHRVEKAEILEHTVLFLQKSAKEDKMKPDDGGHKHSFQDGFSACLQRAGHFLGPEGKGLWLGPALDATFASRLASLDSEASQKSSGTSGSLAHTKSLLRMLRLKSKPRPPGHTAGTKTSLHPYRLCLPQGHPRVPQQPQTQNQLPVDSQSQSLLSHRLWRPWP